MTSYAIPSELFALYHDIDQSLRYVDRFRLPAHLESRLNDYVNYKLTAAVFSFTPASRLHRARLFAFNQTEIHPPHELGAPPPLSATAGRLNPEGQPLLYLADSATTAISETRPWAGAKVTVAVFRPKRVLNFVSLSIGVDGGLINPKQQDSQGFLTALAMELNHISNPAHPGDRLSYLPTQYIASRFRAHRIDGLSYSSALHEGGMNYAVFDPDSCHYESASVFEVSSVQVSARKTA